MVVVVVVDVVVVDVVVVVVGAWHSSSQLDNVLYSPFSPRAQV